MSGEEVKKLVRKQPFEPVEMSFSDGRSVLIRHPDQVVVARRHVILGLAQVLRRRGQLSTPDNGEQVAKDWMLVDLMHVVSIEPANGGKPARRGGRPRKR